jgi:hypothetical protein
VFRFKSIPLKVRRNGRIRDEGREAKRNKTEGGQTTYRDVTIIIRNSDFVKMYSVELQDILCDHTYIPLTSI